MNGMKLLKSSEQRIPVFVIVLICIGSVIILTSIGLIIRYFVLKSNENRRQNEIFIKLVSAGNSLNHTMLESENKAANTTSMEDSY